MLTPGIRSVSDYSSYSGCLQVFSQMVIIFCTIIILNADICRCGTKYSTGFFATTQTPSQLLSSLPYQYQLPGACCQRQLWPDAACLIPSAHGCIVVLQNGIRAATENTMRRYVHVIKHMTLMYSESLHGTTGYISLWMKCPSSSAHSPKACNYPSTSSHQQSIYNFICYTRILRICFVDLAVWCSTINPYWLILA